MRTGSVTMRSARLAVVVLAVLMFGVVPSASSADAATAGGLTWSVTIDGRRTTEVDRNAPLVLRPESSPRLVIDLANRGPREVAVRAVRITGRVIGMSFFSYTTRLDVALPPGATTRREVDLDLDDLGSQAVGLIPARAQLVGADRAVLGQLSFPVDVRGSALSVYAAFGLAVAGITLVLLVSLLLAIARRRLPRNRWQRALRFLPAGAGLGMTATFTLSATRLLTPSGPSWLTLVIGCAVAAFAVGYLLPLGLDATTTEDAMDAAGAAEEARAAENGQEDLAPGVLGATS